jgi:hypothetical protein
MGSALKRRLCNNGMHHSLLLVLVEFPRDNLDELRLVDGEFLLDVVLLLDGLVVGAEDELLDLLLSQILLEVLHHLRQAALGDHARILPLVYKKPVGLLDVLIAVLLTHLYYHDLQELLEVDLGLVKLGILLPIA